MFGFIICSIIAILFFTMGINTYRSPKPKGDFNFTHPPLVKNIKRYNHALGLLFLAFALILECLGIPFLFLKQNSPWFVLIAVLVSLLSITFIATYFYIETRFTKNE